MARFLSALNSSSDDLPSNIRPGTDFVAIVAAFICALICVLGFATMARCACLRRRRSSRSSSSSSAAAKKGVDKKVIQALPMFTFTSSAGFAAEECAICLADFAEGDEIRVLPDCGHGFHAQCIDRWLAARSSCPSCRQCLAPVACQKSGPTPAGRKAVEEATFLP